MATAEPSYKVILCGEYGVGKSSIFRRFLYPDQPSLTTIHNTSPSSSSQHHHKSTVGLDQCTRPFTVGTTPVKLTMWDTGGMERMSFIGASYYRGANAALLVYDCGNKDTFSILSQYILDIAMNAEGAKIFLCGNDSCGEARDSKEKVQEADMEQFMGECSDMLSGVYKVSCKDNLGLEDMFRDMARVLHMDAMKRLTLPRDVIRPAEVPLNPPSEENSQCAC